MLLRVEDTFYPSRWAKAGLLIGVIVSVNGVIQMLQAVRAGSWILAGLAAGLVLFGPLQARRMSKIGIYVSSNGITCRSWSWFGAHGTWPWTEIERTDVYLDPNINNPPAELVAITRSGEMIRLGRLDRRSELRKSIDANVSPA
jgi:hypothetical protein